MAFLKNSVVERYKRAFRLEPEHPDQAQTIYKELHKVPPGSFTVRKLAKLSGFLFIPFFLLGIALSLDNQADGDLETSLQVDIFINTIMLHIICVLPILGFMGLYYYISKDEYLPKKYLFAVLGTLGLIRYNIISKNYYQARNYTSVLENYPIRKVTLKELGKATLSYLDGNLNSAIYHMNGARANSDIAKKYIPYFHEAMDRCVMLFNANIPSANYASNTYGNYPDSATRGPSGFSSYSPENDIGDEEEIEVVEENKLKILRETENIRGYIRMKIAVVNDFQTVITNVGIELIYDENVFRLSKIEPSYVFKGNSVKISTIGGKEKKTVAFYLDPAICTTSMIDAVISYRDHTGNLHTIPMRSKEVNVVCPIFFTQTNANIAMLKNLMCEELLHQDNRIYSIPKSLSTKRSFDLARDILSSRDVAHIRDYTDKLPNRAEAWYYGETKVKGHKIVIKVGVEQEEEVIVIFAATDHEETLTGLLAELGSDLRKKYTLDIRNSNIQIRSGDGGKTADGGISSEGKPGKGCGYGNGVVVRGNVGKGGDTSFFS